MYSMALTTSRISAQWCVAAPISAAAEAKLRSAPIPHPSRRLHSADHRGDIAVEWFQSTSCAPVSFGNQMDTQVSEITQFILGQTLRHDRYVRENIPRNWLRKLAYVGSRSHCDTVMQAGVWGGVERNLRACS